MAGKKGQVVQLQTEVNNEEDWDKLLTKEGLVVVDIYSDWCGPCVGMIGNLKKVKLEIGGDVLHLAVAKSDEIAALKRFRNKSEPTWMFIGSGQLVNVMFGANAPKLMRLIESELKQEQKVMRGETWRRAVPFDELCEEEKERYEAAEKIRKEAERAEAEKMAIELEEKRTRLYSGMAEGLLYETILICFPHTLDDEHNCPMLQALDPIWQACGVYVSQQQRNNITKEICEEIFYRGAMEITDDLLQDLALGACVLLWLKCQVVPALPGGEGTKELGEIEKLICEAVNKVKLEDKQELVVPDPDSIPAHNRWQKIGPIEMDTHDEEAEIVAPLIETNIPGCWTPASYFTKSAVCKFLFPQRAEKVIIPEEPPPPPKIVLVFEASKDKECFELAQEYEDEVLNIGYFNNGDPNEAKQICATPKQYSKVLPFEVIVVVAKKRSDPLLTFAAVGALYVSPDEKTGAIDADKFFPPGAEPTFHLPDSVDELPVENAEKEVTAAGQQKEEVFQNDDDLMASLGVG